MYPNLSWTWALCINLDQEENMENGGVANNRAQLRTQSTVISEDAVDFEGSKGNLSGLKLMLSQFFGLVIKRFIYTKRRYLLYGILGIVPMVLAIITMTTSNGSSNRTEFEPLALNKDTYRHVVHGQLT